MQNGPLTRYAKSRVVHAPGMPEHFPHHRLQRKPIVSDLGMHHGTCVTHVPWCVSGSLNRCGGENVPGILGACPARNFTYLVRGPLGCAWCPHGIIGQFPTSQMTSKMAEENVEISQFVSFVEILFSYFFLYILRANGYIFINKTIQCGPFGKVSEKSTIIMKIHPCCHISANFSYYSFFKHNGDKWILRFTINFPERLAVIKQFKNGGINTNSTDLVHIECYRHSSKYMDR